MFAPEKNWVKTSSDWLQVLFQLRRQWLSKSETKYSADRSHAVLLFSPASSSYSDRSHALFFFIWLCSSDRLPGCLSPCFLSLAVLLSSIQTEILLREELISELSKHPKAQIGQYCGAFYRSPSVEPQWGGSDVKPSRRANTTSSNSTQVKLGTFFSCDVSSEWPLNHKVNSENQRKGGILCFFSTVSTGL